MLIEFKKLTIDVVEIFHKQLLHALEDAKGDLDFSNVEKIDMAAIQLLLSFKKSCQRYDIVFEISNLSTSVQRVIELTGCQGELCKS